MAFVTENIFLIAIALTSGIMLLWPSIAGRAAGAAGLDVLNATRLINDRDPVVVDVRSPTEFAAGHLINSRNVPLEQIGTDAAKLPGNRPLLLVCASGARSGRAVAKLRSAGRDDVFNLTGGLQGWTAAGLPVHKG